MQCCNFDSVDEENVRIFFLFIQFNYLGCAQIEEIAVVGATVCLNVGQYFASVLSDECAPWNFRQSTNAEPLDAIIALEYLQRHFRAILYDAIFAQQFIATADIVAFEDHGRIMKVEITVQASLGIVPILNGYFAALAILCGATAEEKCKMTGLLEPRAVVPAKVSTHLSKHEHMRICDTRRSI